LAKNPALLYRPNFATNFFAEETGKIDHSDVELFFTWDYFFF
jgi:hypothetical protein